MKIYKIAQNYQYVPQNPSGPSNPDVNLQNMQNAQAALGTLDEIIAAAEEVSTAIDNLQDIVNTGDLGLKQAVSNKLAEALKSNSAVSLLMHMNLLPNVETLFDATEFNWVKTKITNDMQSIKGSYGEQGSPGSAVNP